MSFSKGRRNLMQSGVACILFGCSLSTAKVRYLFCFLCMHDRSFSLYIAFFYFCNLKMTRNGCNLKINTIRMPHHVTCMADVPSFRMEKWDVCCLFGINYLKNTLGFCVGYY